MKRFTMGIILIFFMLSLTQAKPLYRANIFNEGVYRLSDFNFSPNNIYTIQNTSSTGSVFVAIFDENQAVLQTIRLGPNSDKYNLLPLRPTDRIMIVGEGEVFIY